MAVSYRGAISFGMVHIPVGLHTATQDNDIHFNQLCKEDGSRGKYKKVCAGCGKENGSGDIVKGFEYEKGKYVTLTDDDFEKAKSEKDKTIHILHFVSGESVNLQRACDTGCQRRELSENPAVYLRSRRWISRRIMSKQYGYNLDLSVP